MLLATLNSRTIYFTYLIPLLYFALNWVGFNLIHGHREGPESTHYSILTPSPIIARSSRTSRRKPRLTAGGTQRHGANVEHRSARLAMLDQTNRIRHDERPTAVIAALVSVSRQSWWQEVAKNRAECFFRWRSLIFWVVSDDQFHSWKQREAICVMHPFNYWVLNA